MKIYNQQFSDMAMMKVINVREHSAILIIFPLKMKENTTWDIWYKLK